MEFLIVLLGCLLWTHYNVATLRSTGVHDGLSVLCAFAPMLGCGIGLVLVFRHDIAEVVVTLILWPVLQCVRLWRTAKEVARLIWYWNGEPEPKFRTLSLDIVNDAPYRRRQWPVKAQGK